MLKRRMNIDRHGPRPVSVSTEHLPHSQRPLVIIVYHCLAGVEQIGYQKRVSDAD